VADSWNTRGPIGTRSFHNVDQLIAAIAQRQHGVVARRDLLEAGVDKQSIGYRLSRGRLYEIQPGAYAVGHGILTTDGFRMAAVLAAGAGAVLSHRAAGSHLGFLRSDVLDITLERKRRPLRRIRVHKLPLPADEVTSVRAIPVTTVSRTLFDLAAVLPRRLVERAVNEAQYQRHADPLSLGDIAERYPRRHGIGTIKAILADWNLGAGLTRSELEERFLSFVGKAGLPRPEVNAPLQVAGLWIECDCLWREARVIVELDG
jgi:hypothetical protein